MTGLRNLSPAEIDSLHVGDLLIWTHYDDEMSEQIGPYIELVVGVDNNDQDGVLYTMRRVDQCRFWEWSYESSWRDVVQKIS